VKMCWDFASFPPRIGSSFPPRIDRLMASLFRIYEALFYQVELKINFVDM
jgi:hypothetical protein